MDLLLCCSKHETKCPRNACRKDVLPATSIPSPFPYPQQFPLHSSWIEQNKSNLLIKQIDNNCSSIQMEIISQRELNPFYKKNYIKISEKSIDRNDSQNRVEYRGITLREYFRLCEETISSEPMHSIEEERNYQDEDKQTPEFGLKDIKDRIKEKMRTEHSNEEARHMLSSLKKMGDSHETDHRSYNRINISMEEANLLASCKKSKKRRQKSKRVVALPAKISGESFNKTSTGSFYYINEKKDKMLEKMRVEKERINSMKLNEAMLVTKYATKFGINAKDMIK